MEHKLHMVALKHALLAFLRQAFGILYRCYQPTGHLTRPGIHGFDLDLAYDALGRLSSQRAIQPTNTMGGLLSSTIRRRCTLLALLFHECLAI